MCCSRGVGTLRFVTRRVRSMAFRTGVSSHKLLRQLTCSRLARPSCITQRWLSNGTQSGDPPKDKKLFTPGPLGVSLETKKAMLRDYGSRDTEFMKCVTFIRSRLLEIADVSADEFTAVPLQGSGTYAVESVLTTTTPRDKGKVFIMQGGAYGKRFKQICDVAGLETVVLTTPEVAKLDLAEVEAILKQDKSITNVAMIHCETSTGVVNPVEEVGKLVAQHAPQAMFFVDAMSSFGAIPLNLTDGHIDFLVSSANKCIEGVPGFSFVIGNKAKLLKCRGWSKSLSLDIVDQYENLEKTGQFRFTPPTHTMLAFRQALLELEEEGGVAGRAKRYSENRRVLRDGMKKFGFKEFLDDSHKGYIITSYFNPSHPNYDFKKFYEELSARGQVIYPGKVSDADCFRIGNIGRLYPSDLEHLLVCIEEVLKNMNVPLPLEN